VTIFKTINELAHESGVSDRVFIKESVRDMYLNRIKLHVEKSFNEEVENGKRKGEAKA
jgi:hypothetical protein